MTARMMGTRSLQADEQKKEDEAVTALPVACAPAAPSLPPTIIKEVKEMFLRLGFSQVVVLKLVEDQWIVSPQTLPL